MIWFWLALGASILWGLSYAISGALSRSIPAEVLMLFTYVVGLPLYGFVCWKNGTLEQFSTMWRWPNVGWGAAIVVAFVVANLFILHAFRITDNPFLVSTVEMTYPVFVLLFGIVIFNMGNVTWQSAAGLVLVAAGLACLYGVKQP